MKRASPLECPVMSQSIKEPDKPLFCSQHARYLRISALHGRPTTLPARVLCGGLCSLNAASALSRMGRSVFRRANRANLHERRLRQQFEFSDFVHSRQHRTAKCRLQLANAPEGHDGTHELRRIRRIHPYGFSLGLGIDICVFQNLFVRVDWEYTQFPNIDDVRVNLNSVHAGVGLSSNLTAARSRSAGWMIRPVRAD
jgi:hypothetical protein